MVISLITDKGSLTIVGCILKRPTSVKQVSKCRLTVLRIYHAYLHTIGEGNTDQHQLAHNLKQEQVKGVRWKITKYCSNTQNTFGLQGFGPYIFLEGARSLHSDYSSSSTTAVLLCNQCSTCSMLYLYKMKVKSRSCLW